jgi:hypothetical protein
MGERFLERNPERSFSNLEQVLPLAKVAAET